MEYVVNRNGAFAYAVRAISPDPNVVTREIAVSRTKDAVEIQDALRLRDQMAPWIERVSNFMATDKSNDWSEELEELARITQ